jgi:hypothetical protein
MAPSLQHQVDQGKHINWVTHGDNVEIKFSALSNSINNIIIENEAKY